MAPLPPKRPMSLPPSPQQGGNLDPIIVFGAVAILIVIGLSFAIWISVRKKALPPRENVTLNEKHKQTKDAFVRTNVSATDQNSTDVSKALEQFNTALVAGSTVPMKAVFDADRLSDEIQRMGALSGVPADDVAQFKIGLSKGLDESFRANYSGKSWSTHKLRKVMLSDNGTEAVAYDLETHGSGMQKYTVKMRYWLRKTGSAWRVWDLEDLEEGLRISTLVASVARSAGADPSSSTLQAITQASSEIKTFIAAMKAADWKAAQASLDQLKAVPLPPELDVLRPMFSAILDVKQNKYQQCLTDCDAVAAMNQDVPAIHYYRAQAYNRLGQYQKAVQSCDESNEALGPDSEVYFEKGFALEHLKQNPQAIEAYEKSLDEGPDGSTSLAALARLLPAQNQAEVSRRLTACDNPRAVFAATAAILEHARDGQGLKSLTDGYTSRSESAQDTDLTYYQGESAIFLKNYRQAESILKALQPPAGVTAPKAYVSEYYYAAGLAGDSLVAYSSAGDKKEAFAQLGRRLLNRSDYAGLKQLVTARRKDAPTESLAFYYWGTVLQHEHNYAGADGAYANAIPGATAIDLSVFQRVRVNARYEAGSGLSAYKDLEPKDQIFVQLARLFSAAKKTSDLIQLVAMRKADAPDDRAILIWDATAKFQSQDYPGTIDVLVTFAADKADQWRWTDLYVRSKVRLKDFEEARHHLDIQNVLNRGEKKDDWHSAVVECAAGNVAEATRSLDAVLQADPTSIAGLYNDPDIGPALATPAFVEWCRKNPRPVAKATTVPVKN